MRLFHNNHHPSQTAHTSIHQPNKIGWIRQLVSALLFSVFCLMHTVAYAQDAVTDIYSVETLPGTSSLGTQFWLIQVANGATMDSVRNVAETLGGVLVHSYPNLAMLLMHAEDQNFDDALLLAQMGIDIEDDNTNPNDLNYRSNATTLNAPTQHDTSFAEQWNIRRVKADQAWDKATGKDVRIAIIGLNGLISDDRDLNGKIDRRSCTTIFGKHCDLFNRDSEHDMRVARTAAASFGKGPLVGVAPNVRLASYRFLLGDDDGSDMYLSQLAIIDDIIGKNRDGNMKNNIDILQGAYQLIHGTLVLQWLADVVGFPPFPPFDASNPEILVYSFTGASQPTRSFLEEVMGGAYAKLEDAGVTAIYAAGNQQGELQVPGRCLTPASEEISPLGALPIECQFSDYASTSLAIPTIFNVSATGIRPLAQYPQVGVSDPIGWNSNLGSFIGIAAPGGDFGPDASETDNNNSFKILTNVTPGTNEKRYSFGTSQSSPHVSGAAALIIERYMDLNNGEKPTPAEVRAILTNSAEPLVNYVPPEDPYADVYFDRFCQGGAFCNSDDYRDVFGIAPFTGNVTPERAYGAGMLDAEAAVDAVQ